MPRGPTKNCFTLGPGENSVSSRSIGPNRDLPISSVHPRAELVYSGHETDYCDQPLAMMLRWDGNEGLVPRKGRIPMGLFIGKLYLHYTWMSWFILWFSCRCTDIPVPWMRHGEWHFFFFLNVEFRRNESGWKKHLEIKHLVGNTW